MIFEEKFNYALLIVILRLCFLVEIAYKMSVEPEKSKGGEVPTVRVQPDCRQSGKIVPYLKLFFLTELIDTFFLILVDFLRQNYLSDESSGTVLNLLLTVRDSNSVRSNCFYHVLNYLTGFDPMFPY